MFRFPHWTQIFLLTLQFRPELPRLTQLLARQLLRNDVDPVLLQEAADRHLGGMRDLPVIRSLAPPIHRGIIDAEIDRELGTPVDAAVHADREALEFEGSHVLSLCNFPQYGQRCERTST